MDGQMESILQGGQFKKLLDEQSIKICFAFYLKKSINSVDKEKTSVTIL